MQISSGAFAHDYPGPAALERAMQGHTLVDGGLVGICQRRR